MTSIRAKLYTGLIAILAVLLLQAGVFYYSQSKVERNLDTTVKTNAEAMSKISSLAVLVQQIRRYEKEYIIYASTIERRKAYAAEWTQAVQKSQALLLELQANKGKWLTTAEAQNIQAWLEALDFYRGAMQKIFEEVSDQNSPANMTLSAAESSTRKANQSGVAAKLSAQDINAMIGPGKDKLSSVLIKGLDAVMLTKTNELLALPGQVSDGFHDLSSVFFVTVLLGILAAISLMFLLPSAITKPLDKLTAATELLSKGDVNVQFETGNIKEFAILKASLERLRISQLILMQQKLKR